MTGNKENQLLRKLRSQPPFTGVPRGPGRKVPHGVFFDWFWAPGSECPKECFLSAFWWFQFPFLYPCLAHQNRTIAIASDFRIDGTKSPEIPQKDGVLGSEITTRNRKSLATFHRTLKSQCKVSFFGWCTRTGTCKDATGVLALAWIDPLEGGGRVGK